MNIKRVIAATALAVVPLAVPSPALAAPATAHGAEAAAVAVPAQVSQQGATYADTVLTKVNELRASLGLQPVTRYQELDVVAQEWSEHQASTSTMEHRPDFTSAYPSGWTTGSENVAWRTDGGDVGALIFDQWLNSPGHYQNMVNRDVNSIGIGFAQTSDGRWYATQNFAAYNPSNTPLTPTTTSNTPPSTSNIPPTTDTTVSAPAPTPSETPSAPATETTSPTTQTAPPATETAISEATPIPSAPATTVTTKTTTSTGTPAKPSSTPAVAASGRTPTKHALATTGPSIAVAVVAAGLLGTGAFLVMRRRQAS